jgi:hypothetical protein
VADVIADFTVYGPQFADLLASERLMELGPGRPVDAFRRKLDALTPETLFGDRPLADPSMARACLAGLWLYYDFLDASHSISQDLHTHTGSYWHAIMHRREPDPDNAKYWFRRIGEHPVLTQLPQWVNAVDPEQLLVPRKRLWDPFWFVDACEAARHGRSSHDRLCWQLQLLEWQLLFDHCCRTALGIAA